MRKVGKDLENKVVYVYLYKKDKKELLFELKRKKFHR